MQRAGLQIEQMFFSYWNKKNSVSPCPVCVFHNVFPLTFCVSLSLVCFLLLGSINIKALVEAIPLSNISYIHIQLQPTLVQLSLKQSQSTAWSTQNIVFIRWKTQTTVFH